MRFDNRYCWVVHFDGKVIDRTRSTMTSESPRYSVGSVSRRISGAEKTSVQDARCLTGLDAAEHLHQVADPDIFE
jgi:hypothetical protein